MLPFSSRSTISFTIPFAWVFAESVPDSPEMTVYKEVLGTVNCRMAGMADQVTEVVYGIPVEVKR